MRTYVRGVFDVYSSYLRIARLLPSGGTGLVALLTGLNLLLGILPACFIVATSVMVGRVPAAVAGGTPVGLRPPSVLPATAPSVPNILAFSIFPLPPCPLL